MVPKFFSFCNFMLLHCCIDSLKCHLSFDTLRYTKALEIIKKLHKDQAQEIKTYKLKLENLQTLKDAAYKVSSISLHSPVGQWCTFDYDCFDCLVWFVMQIVVGRKTPYSAQLIFNNYNQVNFLFVKIRDLKRICSGTEFAMVLLFCQLSG